VPVLIYMLGLLCLSCLCMSLNRYNFQQGRVTDHRVNVTLHSLDQVLAGSDDIDTIVEALERQRLFDDLQHAEEEEEGEEE